MDSTSRERPGQARRPQSLQEALDYARSIIETVRTPLLILDGDLRVLTANRYFYQTFQLTAQETEDRPFYELGCRQWDVPRLRQLLEEVLPTHSSFEDFRVEYDQPRLGRRTMLVNGRLLATAGQPDRILLAFEDVTRREALEGELRRRADDFAESDRLKDEFLAMLAHELRNPLGPVLAALPVLGREDASPEAVARARGVVARQVQQMARMVDDLLEVSRITRGKIQLRKEAVELHDIVDRAVEMSRHHLDDRRHRLLVSLPPRPLLLDADAARLQQALANLLNNAAKYTPPGGKVTLLAEREEDRVTVTVEDTGQGIAPAFLPRVFDLFAQEDRSLDRAAGGLGIGLTLVKSIAELHGGTVEAHSPGVGQGSTFVVRLPGGSEARPRSPAAGPARAGDRVRSNGRRILVVDDMADAVDMLCELLRLDGYSVRTAGDGRGALEAARSFRPDVVLLDIGLPAMDGFEVARQLRRMPEAQGALLVAVTGYGREVDRRRGREAGFDHYLVKPLSPAALQELLPGMKTSPPAAPR